MIIENDGDIIKRSNFTANTINKHKAFSFAQNEPLKLNQIMQRLYQKRLSPATVKILRFLDDKLLEDV